MYMKEKLVNAVIRIYRFISSVFVLPSARYVVWAVLTVTFAEVLNLGLPYGLTFMFRHPLSFVSAVLIVYFSFTLTLPASRRIGTFILVEGFWIGIAIANSILLSYRINPLSAVDFSILFSVFSIIGIYISPLQAFLIVLLILSAIALAVIMMIKLPKEKTDYKNSAVCIAISSVLTIAAFISSAFVFSDDIDSMNLPEVYREYGFIYSFSLSCVDRGIERPDEYSRVNISNMLSEEKNPETTADTAAGDEPEEETEILSETDLRDDPEEETTLNSADDPLEIMRPNVIFVQLESFFDPKEINGLEISENPIPNFTAIRETCPSGALTVPVAGAGTVNTEFEVLCGIPLSVFGLGEYPYETYLTENPCESMAYYMRKNGYTSHSFHNHTGTFYDRYIVMKNLGFDTFTPVEYMSDVDRNMLGWAHDDVLCEQILGAVKSTEGADFIYAISVQAHGKYVSVPGDYGDIKVTGEYEDASLYAMEYYVNQIYETDRFIGELLSQVSQISEDTVIVFFGDHQPSLDLTEDDIRSGSVYNTEYVIWSNFSLDHPDEDIYSYELSSKVLGMLDIDGGVITKIHQLASEGEEAKEKLSDIAYDIFFGEKYAYGGTFPYDIPDMRFGWHDISSDRSFIKNGVLYVFGDGFTESSVIVIDGKRRYTVYISKELIVATDINEIGSLSVAQVADNGFVFGETDIEFTDNDKINFEIVKEGENGNQTEQ